jgi:hypothetical protein
MIKSVMHKYIKDFKDNIDIEEEEEEEVKSEE